MSCAEAAPPPTHPPPPAPAPCTVQPRCDHILWCSTQPQVFTDAYLCIVNCVMPRRSSADSQVEAALADIVSRFESYQTPVSSALCKALTKALASCAVRSSQPRLESFYDALHKALEHFQSLQIPARGKSGDRSTSHSPIVFPRVMAPVAASSTYTIAEGTSTSSPKPTTCPQAYGTTPLPTRWLAAAGTTYHPAGPPSTTAGTDVTHPQGTSTPSTAASTATQSPSAPTPHGETSVPETPTTAVVRATAKIALGPGTPAAGGIPGISSPPPKQPNTATHAYIAAPQPLVAGSGSVAQPKRRNDGNSGCVIC